MTWIKVILAGLANAVLLGLAFGWVMRQYPIPPTQLVVLMQGAGGGILMGHILWATTPRTPGRTVRWRRLARSLALADLAAIPPVAVAAWLFIALALEEAWFALILLNVLFLFAFMFLSLAIANRVLAGPVGDASGPGAGANGLPNETE